MARPVAGQLDLDALAAAERAGIVQVRPPGPGGRVEFTHPLFGSAVYAALPAADRRRLHRDLAGRTDSPEERARHLALAADGPDEATAAALDTAAEAASARGAADLAVELKELACQLTPPGDSAARLRRDLELADRRYFAGDATGARRGLERSAAALPPGPDRAEVLLELGSVVWTQAAGDEAYALMQQALDEAERPELRARIHSRISAMADDCDIAVRHGEAALDLLDPDADPLLYSFALLNLALFRLYAGHGADHAAIERGMALQREAAVWEVSTVPAFWARNFDDFGIARRRFTDHLRAFAERGDEASSCGVLAHLAIIEAMTGQMDRAQDARGRGPGAGRADRAGHLRHGRARGQGPGLRGAGELDQAGQAGRQMLRRLAGAARRDHSRAWPGRCSGRPRWPPGTWPRRPGSCRALPRSPTCCTTGSPPLTGPAPTTPRRSSDWVTWTAPSRLCPAGGPRERAAPALDPAVAARSRGLLNAARGELDAGFDDYQRALAAHRTWPCRASKAGPCSASALLHRRRNERRRAQASLTEAAAGVRGGRGGRLGGGGAAELRRARAGAGGRTSSPPPNGRSPRWPAPGCATPRSPPGSSCPPRPSRRTCPAPTASSASGSRAELSQRLAVGPPDTPRSA